eukprot:336364-Rhodomonas_salina.1
MEFLALVGTTRGVLSAVGVAMYHHLAHLATEGVFEARGWWTSGETARGYSALFHWMRSSNACRFGGRLAMALCKASGQRGLAQADQVRADDLRHSDGDDLFGWG